MIEIETGLLSEKYSLQQPVITCRFVPGLKSQKGVCVAVADVEDSMGLDPSFDD